MKMDFYAGAVNQICSSLQGKSGSRQTTRDSEDCVRTLMVLSSEPLYSLSAFTDTAREVTDLECSLISWMSAGNLFRTSQTCRNEPKLDNHRAAEIDLSYFNQLHLSSRFVRVKISRPLESGADAKSKHGR